MKKKFLLAMSLMVCLAIIATIIIYVEKYQTSQEFETNKYKKEVEEVLNLVENQQVLKIVKNDLDSDETKDFIVLLGEEKTTSNNTDVENNVTDVTKKITTDILVYENVEFVIVNGITKDVVKYESKKTFDSGVDLNIYEDKNGKYIFLNDTQSGNVVLTSFKDNSLTDLIKDNFGDDFKGYEITANFDDIDSTKLKLKLDNKGISYLIEKKDEYTLDFANTKVNKDNYRTGYVLNKYSSYSLENIGSENILRLTAIQNILYPNTSLTDDFPKTAGTVKSMFKLDGNKFVAEGVLVKE
jgi:hypothetical protein